MDAEKIAAIRERYERVAEEVEQGASGYDLVAPAKLYIAALVSALDEANAARERAEAALSHVVDDMREVDWYYFPSDIQHEVVSVLGDKTDKTKRQLALYAQWASEDDAPKEAT